MLIWNSECDRFSITGQFLKTKVSIFNTQRDSTQRGWDHDWNPLSLTQEFASVVGIKPWQVSDAGKLSDFHTVWDRRKEEHSKSSLFRDQQSLRRKYHQKLHSHLFSKFVCPLCLCFSASLPYTQPDRGLYSSALYHGFYCPCCDFKLDSKHVFQCDLEPLISFFSSPSLLYTPTSSSSISLSNVPNDFWNDPDYVPEWGYSHGELRQFWDSKSSKEIAARWKDSGWNKRASTGYCLRVWNHICFDLNNEWWWTQTRQDEIGSWHASSQSSVSRLRTKAHKLTHKVWWHVFVLIWIRIKCTN